jgi:hypothetical protein
MFIFYTGQFLYRSFFIQVTFYTGHFLYGHFLYSHFLYWLFQCFNHLIFLTGLKGFINGWCLDLRVRLGQTSRAIRWRNLAVLLDE